MEITISNTSKIVHLNGIPARVWEGKTASGIGVVCFITRIAVLQSEDSSQFACELLEQRPPSVAAESFPLHLFLT